MTCRLFMRLLVREPALPLLVISEQKILAPLKLKLGELSSGLRASAALSRLSQIRRIHICRSTSAATVDSLRARNFSWVVLKVLAQKQHMPCHTRPMGPCGQALDFRQISQNQITLPRRKPLRQTPNRICNAAVSSKVGLQLSLSLWSNSK